MGNVWNRSGSALTEEDSQSRTAIAHLAARRAAKHASAVVASIQDGLIAVDERGRIADVNDKLCAMTGYRRGQLLGKCRYPFWSREDAPVNASTVRAALGAQNAPCTRAEVWMTDRGGDRFRVSMALSPIHGTDGVPMGYVATLRRLVDPVLADGSPETVAAPGEPGTAVSQAVAHVAEAVGADETSQATLRRIAAQAARLIGADACQIVRLDGDSPCLRASWSGPALAQNGTRLIPDEHMVGTATRGASFRWDALSGPAHSGYAGMATLLAEPITAGFTTWGILVVATAGSTGPLDSAAAGKARAFLASTALAIMSVDIRSAAESRATRDQLTRLPNRRAFEAHLRREVSRATRHGHDLSLVIVDLDNLRPVTADRGVDAGDRALETVGAILSRVARASDVVARIGGDSFAWLLPETSSRDAVAAAERVRALIASLDAADGTGLRVSAGISDLRHSGGAAGTLIRQAMRALRTAKQQGRDRSVRFTDVAAPMPQDARLVDHRRRDHGMAGFRLIAKVIDGRSSQFSQISTTGAELAERLAFELGWSEERAALLHEAALVRDIGMIVIPEAVLGKKGGLTTAERDQLRAHAQTSAEMVSGILTEEQAAWIAQHHDRYDGVGNADGRRGEEISEGARIMAIVDLWLEYGETAAEPGRGISRDAMRELRSEAGWSVWPAGVQAFVRMLAVAARRDGVGHGRYLETPRPDASPGLLARAGA